MRSRLVIMALQLLQLTSRLEAKDRERDPFLANRADVWHFFILS